MALSEFDLCLFHRQKNFQDAVEFGARDVMIVPHAADEVAHMSPPYDAEDAAVWGSEVVFVGTWFLERGALLHALIEAGVPLTIYGARWNKAPEWSAIRNHWKGPNLTGLDYVKAIKYAKVALGLVEKRVGDEYTTRSAEIPYIGTVLCAERTVEHDRLYNDGIGVMLWSNAQECAECCRWLLQNPTQREAMAEAGQRRCVQNGMLNEVVAERALARSLAQRVRRFSHSAEPGHEA
jgi:hypothetical protein